MITVATYIHINYKWNIRFRIVEGNDIVPMKTISLLNFIARNNTNTKQSDTKLN